MAMIITTRVALEVASHEGIVRQAYRDSGGTWTWSVGLTGASGHNVEQYIDTPQPMRKCLEVWLMVLEAYADAVRAAFRGHDLTEAQFAAALSFHWNTGAIARASWVKQWRAGNVGAARAAFMAWNKPAEIVGRRGAECRLFFDGAWSNRGTILEYTRLTGRHTPDWGSGVRRDISGIVAAILAPAAPPSRPPAPPVTRERAPSGIAALIAAIFRRIFR